MLANVSLDTPSQQFYKNFTTMSLTSIIIFETLNRICRNLTDYIALKDGPRIVNDLFELRSRIKTTQLNKLNLQNHYYFKNRFSNLDICKLNCNNHVKKYFLQHCFYNISDYLNF